MDNRIGRRKAVRVDEARTQNSTPARHHLPAVSKRRSMTETVLAASSIEVKMNPAPGRRRRG